jgi:hypothetical protein
MFWTLLNKLVDTFRTSDEKELLEFKESDVRKSDEIDRLHEKNEALTAAYIAERRGLLKQISHLNDTLTAITLRDGGEIILTPEHTKAVEFTDDVYLNIAHSEDGTTKVYLQAQDEPTDEELAEMAKMEEFEPDEDDEGDEDDA